MMLSLLFGWAQAGDFEEVREWVQANTLDDRKFLSFLYHARGWVSSSNRGVYYPLKKNELDYFLDFESAVQRLYSIASDGKTSPADLDQARTLIEAAALGSDD
ncbi:hypothetical protein A8146_28500 [Mesorhizobium loti]|nr:hypothetical protein A8146_28500 [Mesorhizobium loti]